VEEAAGNPDVLDSEEVKDMPDVIIMQLRALKETERILVMFMTQTAECQGNYHRKHQPQ
jgi:hypothetical protein